VPHAAVTLTTSAVPHSSSETLAVTAAVVLAALLHAGWNAAAHRISDRVIGFALIGAGYTAVSAALVPWVAVPLGGAWPYLLGSVALHSVYNLLLMRSYQLGDFNQMYPLARGTSPLVVAIVAVTVVGQSLHADQAAGVVIISAGLAVLVFSGGGVTCAGRPAITAAILTGLCIATYTVLDGVGVRSAHSTAGYIGWLFLLQGPIAPVAVAITRRTRVLRDCRGVWVPGLTSGVVSLAAYGIVIWAQTRSNLASVAALREVSILFGAVIGVVFLRERFGAWRIAGAAFVVAGVVLLTA